MLKKIPAWKKRMFIILFLIVFIRVIYIMAGGEIEKQYYTSASIETAGMQEIPCTKIVQRFQSDSRKLEKLELIFNGIAEDKVGAVILMITSENELLYQTNISLANINNLEWKQVFINMPMERDKVYEISLDAKDCTQVPNLLLVPQEDASPEIIESFSDDVSLRQEIAVKYGYLSKPAISDKIMSSFVWFLFFAVFCVFLHFFENIHKLLCVTGEKLFSVKNAEFMFIISELLLSLVIIRCSGIEFQEPTKIIIYLLSVLSSWKLKVKWDDVKKFLNATWKKVGLCILCFYGAFAFVGHRILVYPLNLKITVQGLFVLGITLLWIVPVFYTIFYVIQRMSRWFVLGNSKRMKNSWFFGLLMLFLILPAALNLYANNPGMSSPDTIACLEVSAHQLKGMTDWHPFFYCLVLKLIISIWDSTYAVILVQYFFWGYVMTEGLLYLRKKKMDDKILLAVAFLAGSNAGNFIHLNTIWKDIPYTLSVLWIFILLAKLALDFEEYKRKWYIYLELIIALLGTYLYRQNGIVTFVIIVVTMSGVLYKNVKIFCAVAVTVAFLFIIKVPVYNYFEVVDPGHYGIYIGLSQDILGVYYADGEISKETIRMVNVMTNYNNAEYNYLPTWSNSSYGLSVEPLEFIKN